MAAQDTEFGCVEVQERTGSARARAELQNASSGHHRSAPAAKTGFYLCPFFPIEASKEAWPLSLSY